MSNNEHWHHEYWHATTTNDDGDPHDQAWQLQALAIAPKVGAPLSIAGSSFIILDIVKSPQKLQRTYCRLLLGMSLIDIGFSMAAFFSTWPIPPPPGSDTSSTGDGSSGGTAAMISSVDNALYAVGNEAACTAQGFFIQLGVGAPLYNGALSIFYLLVVALSMTDDKMKRLEWMLHFVPISFALGTAFLGIPLQLYNNTGLWCWIASSPDGCQNGSYRQGEGECQRGQYAWIFRWALYYVPIWCCILLVSINMYVVVHLVWTRQKASQQFDFERTVSSQSAAANDGMMSTSSWGSRLRLMGGGKPKKKKKKNGPPDLASQVAWQAAHYLGSFYLSWLPATIMRTLTALQKEMPYWVVLLVVLVTPLQGCFNCLIYLRPRALKYQRDNPHLTSCGSLTRAFQKTLMMCICCFGDSNHNNTTTTAATEIAETEDAAVMDPSSTPPTVAEPVADEEDPAHSLQVRNSVYASNKNTARTSNDIKPYIQQEGMEESAPEEIIEKNSADDNTNSNVPTKDNATSSVAPREISSFSEPRNA